VHAEHAVDHLRHAKVDDDGIVLFYEGLAERVG